MQLLSAIEPGRAALNHGLRVGVCVIVLVGMSGCATREQTRGGTGLEVVESGGPQGLAELNPLKGSKAMGLAAFSAVTNGVRVIVGMTGLSPGLHVFQVGDTGDCSPPQLTLAGQLTPTGAAQGAGAPGQPQGGMSELGRFAADATGEAHLDFIATNFALAGDNSILGHALFVYTGGGTNAAHGVSGQRVACGIIEPR